MRRLISLAVSAGILFILWHSVDIDAIVAAFRSSDPAWLTGGLLAVVPLTLVTAWRFQLLSRSRLGLGGATRLILSSSTLNAFLPSKMGDIAKAWVLTSRYGYDPKLGLAIVILEKLLDLGSLLVWGVAATLWVSGDSPILLLAAAATAALLALILVLLAPLPIAAELMAWLGKIIPGKAGGAARAFADQWREATGWFWSNRRRATGVLLLSLALWAGHLAQFWLFSRALHSTIPLIDNMAFATLSILVGLLPFTVAGIGTRDAAIVYFYRDWLRPGEGAVLGVLATMRYLMPAIAGLPFVRDYWAARRPAAA